MPPAGEGLSPCLSLMGTAEWGDSGRLLCRRAPFYVTVVTWTLGASAIEGLPFTGFTWNAILRGRQCRLRTE